jgi:DNA adenine methylase Dam
MANYLKSPFNYTGTKYPELEELYSYFPTNCETLVDLFCGGGSVFINSSFEHVIANDVITDLIGFYKELNTKPIEDILEKCKEYSISKNDQVGYNNLRADYNKDPDPYKFFVLCSSCTNNMMRFNKKFKFNQTFGKRCINDNTIEKLKGYQKQMKKFKSLTFTNVNFDKVSIPNNAFVYLDPPYFITEAGYNCYWSEKLEEKLYDFILDLDKNNVKFGLSNMVFHKGVTNDYLKKLAGFNWHRIQSFNNKAKKQSKVDESVEVFICNY